MTEYDKIQRENCKNNLLELNELRIVRTAIINNVDKYWELKLYDELTERHDNLVREVADYVSFEKLDVSDVIDTKLINQDTIDVVNDYNENSEYDE